MKTEMISAALTAVLPHATDEEIDTAIGQFVDALDSGEVPVSFNIVVTYDNWFSRYFGRNKKQRTVTVTIYDRGIAEDGSAQFLVEG